MKFEINVKGWHSEDEWESVDAFDSEDAAEKSASDYFWQDPWSVSKSFDLEVRIKCPTGKIETFNVTAEPSVDFYARLKEAE